MEQLFSLAERSYFCRKKIDIFLFKNIKRINNAVQFHGLLTPETRLILLMLRFASKTFLQTGAKRTNSKFDFKRSFFIKFDLHVETAYKLRSIKVNNGNRIKNSFLH